MARRQMHRLRWRYHVSTRKSLISPVQFIRRCVPLVSGILSAHHPPPHRVRSRTETSLECRSSDALIRTYCYYIRRGRSRILEGVRFEARAYNGGLRALPQRGPGAEPLVRGPGAKAPDVESFLAFARPKERQICPILADS